MHKTNSSEYSLVKLAPLVSSIKWRSDQSDYHSDYFFQSLENKLTVAPIESKPLWIQLLPALIEKNAGATWVREHIVDRIPTPTWEEAKEIFAAHFNTVTITVSLRKKYRDCKQGASETVQSFTERFLDLVHKLKFDATPELEERAVEDLLTRLRSDVHKNFLSFKNVMIGIDKSSADQFNTLDGVISTLLRQSVDEATSSAQLSTGASYGNPSDSSRKHNRTSNYKGGDKHCIYHPNSKSHTTAECKNKGDTTSQSGESKKYSGSFSSGGHSNSSSSKSSSGALSKLPAGSYCYECKATDHWRDKCPVLQNAQKAKQQSGEKKVGFDPSANRSYNPPSTPVKSIRELSAMDVKRVRVNSLTGQEDSITLDPELISFNKDLSSDEFFADMGKFPDSSSSPFAKACSISEFTANKMAVHLDKTVAASIKPTVYAVLDGYNDNAPIKMASDTGCDPLIIDASFAEHLNIPIIPPGEKENQWLAMADNTKVRRLGSTPPLKIKFLFIGATAARPCDPITLTLSCEVMANAADDAAGTKMIFGWSAMHACFLHLASKQLPWDSFVPFMAGRHIPGSDVYTAALKVKAVNTTATVANDADPIDPADSGPEGVSFEIDPHDVEESKMWTDKIMSDPLVQEQIRVNNLISEESFVFGDDAVVKIKLKPDAESMAKFFRRQYPIAVTKRELMRTTIDRWIATKRIERAPAWCKYNNPLLGVAKMEGGLAVDGKIRVCLDPGNINLWLESDDKFPIPHVGKNLERFAGCRLFGEIDLSDCFLQFMLHPDSRQYTSFMWDSLQYQFCGVPFGLIFMSSFVHRFISYKFSDLPFVISFVDNVAFGSTTWKEHRDQLMAILKRCNELNLRVKTAAIKVGYTRMRCLGFIVSQKGIHVDPRKMDIISNWKRPETGAGMQSFLGTASFVRSHIRHYADVTAPLEAVKLNKIIEWNDTLDQHFNQLKKSILNAPLLNFPDFDRPFYLATDASNLGVGGVLYQPVNGEIDVTPGNIVAICSKVLNPTQRNYSAYKKELFALVYALRKFHVYLWGRSDSVLFTDHKPLIYMFTTPNPSPAVQQWMDELLMYNFSVHHRPGILNVLPDSLSRMYDQAYTKGPWGIPPNYKLLPSLAMDPAFASPVVHNPELPPVHVKPVKNQSKDLDHVVNTAGADGFASVVDSSLESLSSSVKGEEIEEASSIAQIDSSHPMSEPPAAPASSGSVVVAAPGHKPNTSNTSIEFLMEQSGKRIPPTKEERTTLIDKEHSLGHFGRDAIYSSLFDNHNIWWPGMRKDIMEIISSCDSCSRFVVQRSGFKPSQYITADGPWSHIQMDCLTHLPKSHEGFTAILVMVDVFTGFVLAFPILTTSAKCIAEKLWHACSMFGLPKIIQSDNGPEFANQVVREITRLMHVDQRFITPWNPRTDGKVERTIGVLSMVIKKQLQGADRYWPFFVPIAQFYINSKISSVTQSTPFALMFGRDSHNLSQLKPNNDEALEISQWKSFQQKIINVIYPAIHLRIVANKEKMIDQQDAKHLILPSKAFPVGSEVMRLDKTRNDKREPSYVGPFVVLRKDENGNCYLQDESDDSVTDRGVPPDQLKLRSPPSVGRDDYQTYTVEKILKHRGEFPDVEYLVKWKHYPEGEATWEPPSSFLDTNCIRKYWAEQPAGDQQPPPAALPAPARRGSRRK
jgi:hypothetical protein